MSVIVAIGTCLSRRAYRVRQGLFGSATTAGEGGKNGGVDGSG